MCTLLLEQVRKHLSPGSLAIAGRHADGQRPGGTESGAARLFQKKMQIVNGVSSFPKPVQIPKPEGNVANAPQERRAEPGTSEFGNLPGRLIGAKEDGAQGNINIYENIRT